MVSRFLPPIVVFYDTLMDSWNVHLYVCMCKCMYVVCMYVCMHFKTQNNIKTTIEQNKELIEENLMLLTVIIVLKTAKSSS
jgi:hypothetical protein